MKLYAVTARYLGRPDMGCLDLCAAVARDLGRAMPEAVDGVGLANYRALAGRSIRMAQSVLLRSLWRVGESSSTRFTKLGDLLAVMDPKGGAVFPAVALGGGLAIASFIRDGVRVFRLDDANRCVIARRLPVLDGQTGQRVHGSTEAP